MPDDSSVAGELPRRVRYWRRRAGLKAYQLAAAVGVSPPAVSTWESGKSVPDHETLERVCFACGIDLATFWSPLPDDEGDNGDEAPPAKQAAGG